MSYAPTLANPSEFIRWHRARGTGWQNLSKMTGRSVLDLRREHDDRYQAVHKPAEPVAKGPSRKRVVTMLDDMGVTGAQGAVMGVLWSATEPLTQLDAQLKAGRFISAHPGQESVGHKRDIQRFLDRMMSMGFEIDQVPGKGWRLSDAARTKLRKMAEGTRG